MSLNTQLSLPISQWDSLLSDIQRDAVSFLAEKSALWEEDTDELDALENVRVVLANNNRKF